MLFPHVPPDVPLAPAFEPRGGEGKAVAALVQWGLGVGAEVAVAQLAFSVVWAGLC